MKYAVSALALLAVAAIASPSAAEVAGEWHVVGKVSSFGFTLNCLLQPRGGKLSGVCVDDQTSDPKISTGKSHTLTAGSVSGDAVSWTYQSSFLFTKFNVTYSGTVTGDHMSGTIDAQGRHGAFTAVKQAQATSGE